MRNASAHRDLLLQLIRRPYSPEGVAVNRRYCMSTKHPLIKQLLKQGLIKQVRTFDNHGTGQSRLLPTDGRLEEGPAICPECKSKIKSIWDNDAHSVECSGRQASFYLY